jgi:hypothetical protein
MPEEQKPTQPEAESQEAKEIDSTIVRTRAAVLVDAFLVESGDEWFRITLGEGTIQLRDRIRFAFVMPVEDVRELARILNKLLATVDAEKAGNKTQPAGN